MRDLPGWFACRWILLLALPALVPSMTLVADQAAATKGDEQIGEVLGKPVYRRDLNDKSQIDDELHRVFLMPVWNKYVAEHKKEVEPTKEEIDFASAAFDKIHKEQFKDDEPNLRRTLKELDEQLAQQDLSAAKRKELQKQKESWEQILELGQKPLGRQFAVFMLSHWKAQKHLYDTYGGGRILWQQGGTEAFDATRKWLESREMAGEFKFTDDKLRAKFYAYWTTHNHGSFLTDDPERIKLEFVEPTWALKPPKKEPEKK